MRILFKKTDPAVHADKHTFKGLGISECYVKDLNLSSDKASTLRTAHRHAFYEVHIICSGTQTYEIGNEKVVVCAGELLFIAPQTLHLVASETDDYKKYAVNFALAEDSELLAGIAHLSSYVIVKASDTLLRLLDFLGAESAAPSSFSENIAELSSLECVLLILRLVGARNEDAYRLPQSDARVAMAKQFIEDNVQSTFTIRELASYCYIGEKQLSRIFYREEKCTVAEYVRMQRMKHIQALLASDRYSIRQISEMMHFSSEYYLNSFFKKHTGMTPGEYRAACRKENIKKRD